ncbi:YfcC family protein [Planococcus sp. 1R117A]|uniref:YfcC family protein n=1 Tax=Planococcus sp. 1R117A TaxID=3447020 RepID=UPI003EDBD3D4
MAINTESAEKYKLKEKKAYKLPHVYVILFIMMLLAFVATYLIPSGAFERTATETGAQILVPDTFKYTDAKSVGFFDFLHSIPNGMVQAGAIIFGGLMMGGLTAVLDRTGLLPLLIGKISSVLKSKTILVVPVLMIPIAVFTTITGALELILIYIPIIVPMVIKMGFDRFTGVAIPIVAATAGFSTAITAPATLGLSQQLTELPLYSGSGYRLIIFIIMTGIGIVYVWRYASRVQKKPELGLTYGDGMDEQFKNADTEELPKTMTKRQKAAVAVLAAGFVVMLYGLLQWKWYFIELGGWYAFLGIAIGLICGFSPSRIAEFFHEGFKMMLMGTLLIGLARSISIILEQGEILDTVVHFTTQLVGFMPAEIAAISMLIVQGLFNFLVGSGSGQAMIMMPIMSGLSDVLDVTRQTAVLAFQFGDGFTNVLYPTSGVLLATLALAHVSYGKWLKFIIPLMCLWLALSAVFLVIAQTIGWGANLQ